MRFLPGARFAVLSPSGRGVAYARLTGKSLDIFATGIYAGFEAKLAHIAGAATTALAFSPDSRRIAFASPNGIELSPAVSGRKPRALPLPARWRGSSYQALRFSPDGKLLAFSRTWGNGKNGTLRNELAIVHVDGTAPRSLVRNPDPYSAQYRPTFSPDGTQIAFAAADGGLALVPADGGRIVRLTVGRPSGSARTDVDPLFSPDGETIAFTRAPGRGGSDVYLVGSDGTGLRRLTTTPLPPRGQPRTGSSALAWSPDGTSVLAFRHDRFAAVNAATGESSDLAVVGVQSGIASSVWGDQ